MTEAPDRRTAAEEYLQLTHSDVVNTAIGWGYEGVPFKDIDAEYLVYAEAQLLLQNQWFDIRRSLRPSADTVGTTNPNTTLTGTDALTTGGAPTARSRVEAVREVSNAIIRLRDRLDGACKARLQASTPRMPKVLRACTRLGLVTDQEIRAFLFVVLVNAGTDFPTVTVRATAGYMAKYSNMNPAGLLYFLSDERPHLKLGVIGISDYRFKTNLAECNVRMPKEVLSALTGASMSEAELLKIDGSLLSILVDDPNTVDQASASASAPSPPIMGKEEDVMSDDEDTPEGGSPLDPTLQPQSPPVESRPGKRPRGGDEEHTATCTDVEAMPKRRKGAHTGDGVLPFPVANASPIEGGSGAAAATPVEESTGGSEVPDAKSSNSKPLVAPPHPSSPATTTTTTTPGGLKGDPYQSDFEYLGDVFRVLATLIKIRNTEADIKDDDPEFNVQPKTEAEAQLRELKGKERVLFATMARRLECTRAAGSWMPRVEEMAQRRHLTKFEKLVLLLLVGSTISPDILIAANGRYVMRGEEKRDKTVGWLLYILCDTVEQRLVNRSKFYKSAPLVSDGMLIVSDRSGIGADLMDCTVDIDRRMMDYLVGLDSEFGELVEGSHLLTPTVTMDQIILPAEQRALVGATVGNFDTFIVARKKFGLDDVVAYGAGLVLLFHGASGTGKTMLANAVANKLRKRMLVVNLMAFVSQGKSGEMLKLVFREAKLHDAIIFFDECEGFFESRAQSPLVTSMLNELERYSGLIVMATNKAHVLDEAMHRRITLALEFKKPDHHMRTQIWQKHLPASMPVDPGVDVKALAMDYELSGGLIKNAVLSGLSLAVSRSGTDAVVTMDDLRHGAKLQLRGFFREDGFTRKLTPKRSFGDCVLGPRALADLKRMVSVEKGRKLLYTQWGFEEEECCRQSIVALFGGPSGCGKSLAAEAVGYETGNVLKVVNVAEFIAKTSMATAQNVEKIFSDATKQDAVLVLDDSERLFQCSGADEDACQLIAYHIARFSRIVILIVRSEEYLDTQRSAIKFNFRVTFPRPDHTLRAKLWRQALPKQVPLGELQFAELAREELNGAQIRAAAFFACANRALTYQPGESITQGDLLRAIAEITKTARTDVVSSIFT